jgi:hypothetical protein
MSDIEGFGRRTKGLSEVAFQEAYAARSSVARRCWHGAGARVGLAHPAAMAGIVI